MNKFNSIKNLIEGLDSKDIISLWNKRCEDTNDYDSYVEYMDSFDDLMCGKSPMDIAIMISMGEFHSGDDYYAFNGYGNIRTFSYWDDNDSPVDISEIVDWLIDGGDVDFEIDTDELADSFVDEYYPDITSSYKAFILSLIEDIASEETFDLLTEDWDDLHATLDEYLDNRKKVLEKIDSLGKDDCIPLDEIDYYGENGSGKALGISKDKDGNTQVGYDINGFLFIDKVEIGELPYLFINDVAENLNK